MYDRRYWREFGIWITLYLALMLASSQIIHLLPQGSYWRYVVLLPVWLIVLAGSLIELRLVRRLDELQRAIYLEASAVALWVMVLTIVTAWLLEAFAKLPRLMPSWYLFASATGFGLGYLNAHRRYR